MPRTVKLTPTPRPKPLPLLTNLKRPRAKRAPQQGLLVGLHDGVVDVIPAALLTVQPTRREADALNRPRHAGGVVVEGHAVAWAHGEVGARHLMMPSSRQTSSQAGRQAGSFQPSRQCGHKKGCTGSLGSGRLSKRTHAPLHQRTQLPQPRAPHCTWWQGRLPALQWSPAGTHKHTAAQHKQLFVDCLSLKLKAGLHGRHATTQPWSLLVLVPLCTHICQHRPELQGDVHLGCLQVPVQVQSRAGPATHNTSRHKAQQLLLCPAWAAALPPPPTYRHSV